MDSSFDRAFKFVLAREAGFVDDPDDPGGATNYGITIAVLAAWRGMSVSVTDVANLQVKEAEKIYRSLYWTKAWCDRLPAGVDVVVFDMAVNQGVGSARSILAGRLGLVIFAPDMKVRPEIPGPSMAEDVVLSRLEIACKTGLICGLCEDRRLFYRSLPKFKTFGRGWLNRVELLQSYAMRVWATEGMDVSM